MLNRSRTNDLVGRRQPGFTLIELMIAVAIAAILAAIAYPSYQQYVTRTQRGIAKASLVQVMDRQAQYFADNKQFAADLTTLAFSADPFGINRKGKEIAATSSERIYNIDLNCTLVGGVCRSFTLEAIPQLQQASKDSGCGTLRITNVGVKSVSGTSTNCW